MKTASPSAVRAIASSSSSRDADLTRYPVAPALTASRTSTCSPLADRTSTRAGCLLAARARVTSTPETSGICRSRTTTSGRAAAARRIASWPPAAVGDDVVARVGEVPGHGLAPDRVIVDHHDPGHRRALSTAARGTDSSISVPSPGVESDASGASELVHPTDDRPLDPQPSAATRLGQPVRCHPGSVVADQHAHPRAVVVDQQPRPGARAGVALHVEQRLADRGVQRARDGAGQEHRLAGSRHYSAALLVRREERQQVDLTIRGHRMQILQSRRASGGPPPARRPGRPTALRGRRSRCPDGGSGPAPAGLHRGYRGTGARVRGWRRPGRGPRRWPTRRGEPGG